MTKPEIKIKKRQMEILSKAEGFFESSVLITLVKLRLFESIGESTRDAYELARELDLRYENLKRLLNAGVALNMLESEDGEKYSVSPPYAAVLSSSASESFLGDWIQNLDLFRYALTKMDEVILTGEPAVKPSNYLEQSPEKSRRFTLAMHNYASLRGKELAEFLDTKMCKSLLDLGCGPGTYAFQIGLKNPKIDLYMLDNPNILEVTKEIQKKYSIKNQIYYLPMNALEDEIPGSYDIILISNMLHMLGERASQSLIKRLYTSVNSGGSIVIQAQFLSENQMGGRWPVLLDLIQLCTTENGRNHTVDETKRWLEEAGFRNVEFCGMTLLNTNSYLRGYKE